MSKNRKLLKSVEVARILERSPDEVVAMARKGAIRATKQGKYWMFTPEAVTGYKRRIGKAD